MSKAAELAALIGSQTALSNRNLIINGAMQVWQRGTIITGKTSGDNFVADRHYLSLGSAGTWTIEQSTDAPAGFKYSLKYTCTSSVTLSGANYAVMQYTPEGQDMKHLEFGTSNAKTLTLSFWVKSSLSGDFGFTVRNSAGNKCIVKSYTISSANTWEYKTININPATDGTWPDDNGQFGFLNFDLGVGPTYSASSSNSYTTSNKFGLTGGVKIAETTNATWQVTGIQLELGEQATPFEHRSYGDELARCQRYYYFHGQGTGSNSGDIAIGSYYDSVSLDAIVQFPVTMRTTPTVDATSGTNYYVSFRNSAADYFNSFILNKGSPSAAAIGNSSQASGTGGQATLIRYNSASARVAFDSEL